MLPHPSLLGITDPVASDNRASQAGSGTIKRDRLASDPDRSCPWRDPLP